MRKAARIIFKVEMIVYIVAAALCGLCGAIFAACYAPLAKFFEEEGIGASGSGAAIAGTVFVTIMVSMFFVLTACMIVGAVVCSMGQKKATYAKSKNEVITIGVINCIFGSRVGAIFLFVSRPSEYDAGKDPAMIE